MAKSGLLLTAKRWLFEIDWVAGIFGKRRCLTCPDQYAATTEREENLSSGRATYVLYVEARIWRTNPDIVNRKKEPFVVETIRKSVTVRACSRCKSGYLRTSRRVQLMEALTPEGKRGGKFTLAFVNSKNESIGQLNQNLATYLVGQFLPSLEGYKIRERLDV